MDNASKRQDTNWWEILTLPYSDDDLNQMGVSICNKATPHKTPSRSLRSDVNFFDSPVAMIVNSPNGKDRLIQEYERRLNAERALVQTLQVDYEESGAEICRLKLENETLKDKLDK